MFLDVSNGFADVGDTIEWSDGKRRGVLERIETTRTLNPDGSITMSYNLQVKPEGTAPYDYRRVYLHNPERIALVNP
jgi:hypothetical protein